MPVKQKVLREKLEKLKRILKDMDTVLVAFSGGVDSTLLLSVAREVLKDRVTAVTVHSELFPDFEYRDAAKLVKRIRARHLMVRASVLKDRKISANPSDRCYWCKKKVFGRLKVLARKRRLAWVADGTNTDDAVSDYRPGLAASRQLGIRHPLMEAGLTKNEIRVLSKQRRLPTWNKPAYACLASRVPYGEELTGARLVRINRAENYLHALGFLHVRVRDHNGLARIEVPPEQIGRLSRPAIRDRIVRQLKKAGYAYVALDLGGYRMGSLNEVLA